MSDHSLSRAAKDVLDERARQIAVEGWTPDHDDKHWQGKMARAAAAYALHASQAKGFARLILHIWPWGREWWKPKDPRRDLVKAGALILAEIERLDRNEGRAP